MKRKRYESENRSKTDVTISISQSSNSLGATKSIEFNSYNVVIGNPRKRVRDTSNPNLFLPPEKCMRPYSCDVTNDASGLEGKKSFCTLHDYKLASGKEVMNESLLSSDSPGIHLEQVVSRYPSNICEERKPSVFGCQTESRRHTRLYSWQRRRRRKLNLQDVLNHRTSNDKEKKHDCPKPMVDKEPEEEPLVDIVSSDTPYLKQKEVHSHSEKMASWCFNCLMLQAPSKIVAWEHIKRRYIFYDRFLSASVFPRNHILNRLKPNDSGAHSLMKHIFGIPDGQVNTYSPSCARCNGCSAINSECCYHSLLSLLKSLIRNAQRCWNRKLMRKHCLVSPSHQFSKGFNESNMKVQYSSSSMLSEGSHISRSGNEKREQLHHYKTSNDLVSQLDPVDSYCSHQQVVSFIWAVTRRIVPLDLLGYPSTWRALRKNISKFVRLRRFEAFSLKQCIHRLRTTRYPFLSKITPSDCSCEKKGTNNTRKLFHCWIYWFFSYIVVSAVGANFYVTERESGRQDVFYYPKLVWRNLVGRAITSLSKQNYRLIDNASLIQIFKKRAFGFSKVRFVPKDKNLRPIANLRAPSKLRLPHNRKRRLVYRRSVNSSLHELHAILRKIKVEYPQKLGSSVFDYNDIYKKLLQFVSKVRNGSRTMPRVFIVVADVSKAFDSIDQDMLIGIMEDIIEKDEYLLRRYAQVVCTKKSTKAVYAQVPYDYGCINNDTIHVCSTDSILIDQGTSNKIKQERLHYLLREHLKLNLVQLGQNFYVQTVGIPQGSLLSSLLCSFYYGHLEKTLILPYLEKTIESTDVGKCGISSSPNNLLLRLIDDFLFISTSEKQAASFLNRMRRGFRCYNCVMNSEKFGLNFDMGQGSSLVNRIYTGADGVSFLPWSGLLLNCQTLEVQADYTRYWGVHISSTITVQAHDRPAYHLKRKLCDYMRPKCHPIFYNSRINSLTTVSLNAYQAFLLCAMKFHCYIRSVPEITKQNPSYLMGIIERSFSYMYKLIKKRMNDMRHILSANPILNLKKVEFVWLGLSAYIQVLKKKQSRHKELLSLLWCKFVSHGRICNASSHLRYASDDSHSSMFWKIKF